jgi:hypothetical protein
MIRLSISHTKRAAASIRSMAMPFAVWSADQRGGKRSA